MPSWKKAIKSGIPEGEYLEWYMYSLSLKRPKGRRVKLNISSEAQKQINDIEAKRKLRRLIYSNFTRKDFYVTISFSKKPSEADARRELTNYIARLRRARERLLLGKIKYIAVMEGHEKRYHVHIIINKMPADVIMELWGKGNVHISRLDPDGDYEGLLKYMLKEGKKPNRRRWLQSQNLTKPEPETERIKRLELFEPISAPKGYTILECIITDSVFTGVGRYMRMKKIE